MVKEKVFADFGDVEKFRDLAKNVRNDVLANLDTYLATFADKLKEAGVNVHFAEDAKQARDIIAKVAKDNNVSKIVKSKSMITEEIHLNEALEAENIEVTETDLGEFIIQIAEQKPAHIVLPAIHLSTEEVADIFRDWHLYRLILGPAGQQLVADKSGAIAKLPVPEIPFAVIAGGKGTADGYNPLIPGDDDGLVAVSSARLEGAEDAMTLPVLHSFLPFNADVINAVSVYLETGAFRADGVRTPVESAPEPEAANSQ